MFANSKMMNRKTGFPDQEESSKVAASAKEPDAQDLQGNSAVQDEMIDVDDDSKSPYLDNALMMEPSQQKIIQMAP